MPRKRSSIAKSLLLGLLTAIVFTLLAMLALSAALMFLHIQDGLLSTLNQIIKLLSIALGVCLAVPRGSQRGFASGLLIAFSYIVIGYALYVALGGADFSFTAMLGELLVGGAVGAVTGAIRANLYPRRRSAKI